MAKKGKLDDKIDNLDDFDWPDFDFDDGSDSQDDAKAKSRKPVTRVAKKAVKGAASHLANPQTITRSLKRILPTEYGDGVGHAATGAQAFSDVYNTGIEELNKTKREAQKAIRKALPSVRDKIPDRMVKFLEKHQGEEEVDYNSAASKERQRADEINQKLMDLFGEQADDQLKRDTNTQAEKLINQTIAKKRFSTTMGALSSIDNSMKMQLAYQDKVTNPYQRKSLELQYRMTYLLGDLASMMGDNWKTQEQYLKDIVHNTALPEATKITQGEEFKRLQTQRLMNRIGEGLFGETGNYLGNLAKNVSGRAKKSLTDVLRNMRSTMADTSYAASQVGGMGDEDSEDTIVQLLSSMGVDWVVNRYGDRAKDALSKRGIFSNNADRMGYYVNNAGRLLNAEGQRREFGSGFWSKARDFGRGLLHTKSLNGDLGDGLDVTGNMPDHFNKTTNTSLVDIIPGLLARILQSSERARLGVEDIPLVRYDLQTGTFTDSRSLLARTAKRIRTKEDATRGNEALDQLINKIDNGGELRGSERDALKRHLVELNMRQLAYDPVAMAQGGFFGNADPAVKERLSGFIRQRYNVTTDEKGRDRLDKSNSALFGELRSHASDLNVLGGLYGDPTELVKDLIQNGNREELIELGIIDLSSGRPQINYNRAAEMYLGGGYDPTNGQGNPNPSGNGRPPHVPIRRRIGGLGGKRPDALPPVIGPQGPGTGAAGGLIDYDRLRGVFTQALEDSRKGKVPGNQGIAGTTEEWLEAIHSAITKGHQSQQLEWNGLVLEEIMDILTDGRQVTNTLGQLGYSDLQGGRPELGAGPQGKWDRRVANLQRWGKAGGDKVRNLLNTVVGGGIDLGTRAGNAAGGFIGEGWERTKTEYRKRKGQVTDIYVKGWRTPALEAKLLEAGRYVDELTGKTIKTLEDITGPVKDKVTGLQVLSVDDIKQGLRDYTGKLVITEKIKSFVDKVNNGLLGAIGLTAWSVEGAKGVVMGNFNRLKTWATEKANEIGDIYIKGELQPRIMKHLLEAGAYRDRATGKILTKWEDIKGDVEDLQGNLVLTMEDMKKGLVNRWGVEIQDKVKGARDFAMAQFTKGYAIAKPHLMKLKRVGQEVLQVGKNAWGRIKGMFSGWGKALSEGINVSLGSVDGSVPSYLNAQLAVQLGILDAVNALNPSRRKKMIGDADGDGVRDNSWQDILRHRVKGRKGKDGKDKDDKPTERMDANYGGIYDKLKGLKDKLFGGADDVGDLLDDLDGPDRRGGRRGRGGRGRLGRLGRWAKNSRLGRAAGWLGRGAIGLGGTALGALGETALAGTVVNAGIAGASAIGGGLATVGSALATGAAAAGSAIAGVISLPVLAVVGAVAAVGVAAYFAYKWYDSNKDRPLQKLRLVQYGWDTKDDDQAKKILAFEEILAKNVTYGPDGAKLDSIKPDDLKDALDIFDLKPDQQDAAMQSWIQWYTGRFKPIFLGWCNSLQGIDKQIAIGEIDDKMDDANKKMKLFELVTKVNNERVFSVASSPFGANSTMNTSISLIEEVTKEVKDKLQKAVEDADKKGGKPANAMMAGRGFIRNELGDAQAAPETGANAPTLDNISKTMAGAGAFGNVDGKVAALVDNAGNPIQVAANSDKAAERAAKLIPATKLDALRTIRFRTYGLLQLERNWIRALIELEEGLIEKVQVRSGQPAIFNGDLDSVTDTYAAYFGLDAKGGPEWNNFQAWFKARFLPTYLAHVTRVRAISPSANPGEAQDVLKPEQVVSVAEATVAARGDYQGDTVSVWSIPLAPNSSIQPNMDRKSVADNMLALQDAVNRKKLDEEAGKAGGTKDARGSEAPGFFSQVADKTSGAWSTVKGWFGFGDDKDKAGQQQQSSGGGSFTGSNTPAGYANQGDAGGMAGMGSEVIIDHPGGGSKGDINKLPFPKGLKGFEAHKELIAAVAKMTGLDPAMLAGLIATESGFNSSVKAGTSTAQGLGQFIGSTWKEMMRKYASAYGIAPGTPPTDARANALMTALFIRDNAESIQKVLGNSRKVTDVDLYMAHFLGAGGYSKFLKNPGVSAASLLPDAARANPSIFYGPGGARTTDEVVALLGKRVTDNSNRYGGAMKEFAANYTLPTDSQKPAEDTAVGGTEAPDDSSGTPTPGMSASPAPATGGADGGLGDQGAAPGPEASDAGNAGGVTPPAATGPVAGPSGAASPTDVATQVSAQADASKVARDDSMASLISVNTQQLTTLQGIDSKMAAMLDLLGKLNAGGGGQSADQQKPQSQAPKGPMDLSKRTGT